jgi:hypothetical protein
MKSINVELELLLIIIFIMLMHGFSNSLVAQTRPPNQPSQGDGQRGDLFSGDFFVDTRPGGKTSNVSTDRYRPRRSSGKQPALPSGRVFVKLGVTLGLGRPATDAEIKNNQFAKISTCAKRDETGSKCITWQEMVIERISDETPIVDKTPVQMMIEYLASRDPGSTKQVFDRIGYLYVINRVEYVNGKMSPPKLIYPTKQTFEGNSIVLPGKPVILPDPQRLWQITRNKAATQAFETYIIIVSPKPLRDSNGFELQGNNLGDNRNPLELNEALVKNWLRLWGSGVIESDLNAGLGQLFTTREQSASGNPAGTSRDTGVMDADLKQDDPRPQMGFHKAVAPGGTILVTIKLPFKDTTATAAH